MVDASDSQKSNWVYQSEHQDSDTGSETQKIEIKVDDKPKKKQVSTLVGSLILIVIALVIGGLVYYYRDFLTFNDGFKQSTESAKKQSTSGADVVEDANWKTYTNEELGFSIEYPSGLKPYEQVNGTDQGIISFTKTGDLTNSDNSYEVAKGGGFGGSGWAECKEEALTIDGVNTSIWVRLYKNDVNLSDNFDDCSTVNISDYDKFSLYTSFDVQGINWGMFSSQYLTSENYETAVSLFKTLAESFQLLSTETSWETYTNEELGFSIEYPKGYTVSTEETVTYDDIPATVVNFEGQDNKYTVLLNVPRGFIGKESTKEEVNVAGGSAFVVLWLFADPSVEFDDNYDYLNSITLDNYYSAFVNATFTTSSNTWSVYSDTWQRGEKDKDAELAIVKHMVESFQVTEPVADIPTFQEYLTSKCQIATLEDGSQLHNAIAISDLPVELGVNHILTPSTEDYFTCTEDEGSRYISLFMYNKDAEGFSVNLYDDNSEEGGHGGAPFLGEVGDELFSYDSQHIQTYYYLTSADSGPLPINSVGVLLRAIKTFDYHGQPIYANTTNGIVDPSDSALKAILVPYTEVAGADHPFLDEGEEYLVTSDREMDTIMAEIKATFFADMNDLDPEINSKIFDMREALNALSVK